MEENYVKGSLALAGLIRFSDWVIADTDTPACSMGAFNQPYVMSSGTFIDVNKVPDKCITVADFQMDGYAPNDL